MIFLVELLISSVSSRATLRRFEFATRVTLAVGGSTNMMLHLPAIAKEAGIEFSIFDIDRLSDETPLVSKIKPSGQHTLYDFDQAGGVGKVIKIPSKK